MAQVGVDDADAPLEVLRHRQAEVRGGQALAFAAARAGDEDDVDRRGVIGVRHARAERAVLLRGRRARSSAATRAGSSRVPRTVRPGGERRGGRSLGDVLVARRGTTGRSACRTRGAAPAPARPSTACAGRRPRVRPSRECSEYGSCHSLPGPLQSRTIAFTRPVMRVTSPSTGEVELVAQLADVVDGAVADTRGRASARRRGRCRRRWRAASRAAGSACSARSDSGAA